MGQNVVSLATDQVANDSCGRRIVRHRIAGARCQINRQSRSAEMGFAIVALILVYSAVSILLAWKAGKYIKEPDKPLTGGALFEPNDYLPEAQAFVRRAKMILNRSFVVLIAIILAYHFFK
jgi:hypothetical protein